MWQGLGYYTRARNLLRCARLVVDRHQGQFPRSFGELKRLPGIGEYTAAAIASIAFKEAVPVVDGNVFRVLARVFGLESDISSPAAKKQFFALAGQLISHEAPGEFNQALMEFGAVQCVPRNPDCEVCILAKSCEARRQGRQHLLPVKIRKPKVTRRYFHYLVCHQGPKIMMRRRSEKDIWAGLFDFFLVETKRQVSPEGVFRKMTGLKNLLRKVDWAKPARKYKHVLTHQIIEASFYPVAISSRDDFGKSGEGLRAYSIREIKKLPKPALITRYLSEAGLVG